MIEQSNENNKRTIHSSLSISELTRDCYAIFQPIYNTDCLEIISFEALLRHPTISAVEIIMWAEKYGYMQEIFEMMVMKTISIIKFTGVPVSVNISPSQLIFNGGKIELFLKNVISRYNIPEFHLNIEITESVLIIDENVFITSVNKIKKLKVKVFLDDFGAGYTFFSMLNYGVFDVIKIDKNIIYAISENKLMQSFLSSIVAYASVAGMYVIAEGIEREDDLMVVKSVGISMTQGFLFSLPLDTNAIIALYSKSN
ncbi:MAG: EAL domain-containing protein [Plesiomonas sp.]|uniref:EAL domain-containing protein n=1 Tax=Plesiomonas sp. TaxID=2486279 RepID=UPI003F38EFEE